MLIFTSVVFSLLLAGCGGGPDDVGQGNDVQGRQASRAQMKQVYYFDSLPQMVATSHAVVEGVVTAAAPGRVVGKGDDALQFHNVTLRVEEVHYGSVTSRTIHMEEDGFLAPLSTVGERGMYFIWMKQEPGLDEIYRLVSSQGRFLVSGDRLRASDNSAAWADELEGIGLAELARLVAEAKMAIARGEVVPASPARG